jgi:hypothetical protein
VMGTRSSAIEKKLTYFSFNFDLPVNPVRIIDMKLYG